MSLSTPRVKGIYLVIDPSTEKNKLLNQLKSALRGGVDLVQIWNHWPINATLTYKIRLINDLKKLIIPYGIPLLINEDWQLLCKTGLDGVHFDEIPQNIDQIRKEIGKPVLLGLTCSNDLQPISWAAQHNFDYISFCSVFPSASVSSCEIVKPESIQQARKLTTIPIFLSGGILLDNLNSLGSYKIQGIALISGIMDAISPEIAARKYRSELQILNQ
jgi:thiamine-phosphate pyrophosphorylase